MAKIYPLPLVICFILLSAALYAQQNVGIGTSTPLEKLDINGAIRIGTTSGNNEGSVRYNPTSHKFEGRDNVSWKEFGGAADDDWTKVGETPVANDGYDVYHSGNVGIGTAIPLTKLHVKGSGAIAIKAETSSSNDLIPALYAINTIGIAIKAETNSATKPALFAYSASGLALKAQTQSDTMPAIWAFSDSSYAIKAETKSKEWPAMQAYNKDSTGYAFKAMNKHAVGGIEGGNAALFVGDVNFHGAIRNTSALYGGSVAVNDGMTIGSISGANCLTSIPALTEFPHTIGGFNFFSGTSITYANNLNNTNFNGQCRSVTGFSLESTFFDYDVFPINVQLFVRNSFVGAIDVPKANLNLSGPLPGNPPLISLWNADGGWYSKWIFSVNTWNGTDPENINWFVHAVNHGADTDDWDSYKGKISYNWGDSTSSPYYAAFGEVRASGTLYANSISAYGDVAEYFEVAKTQRAPEAGDIVSISKDNAQTFVLSTFPDDPLLAGVISENPSVLVNTPDKGGKPIALTGRVKVKVNLEGGKIKEGDAITSSSTEGIGMKSDGGGMILGHALESFDGTRTDEGKVWILISRMQVAKSAGIKIVQGQDVNLGGMMISGAQKVKKEEHSIFVEWDEQTKAKMPHDIEFDDLVIDLTPFGGKAEMVITKVSGKGFEVSIDSKATGFAGFYYNAEIVSPELHENSPAAQSMTPQEQVTTAKNLYKEWDQVAAQLMSLSGKSLKDMPKGMNVAQIKDFKMAVLESWKKADARLYAKYLSLQDQLGAAINGDANVMRQLND